MKILFVSHFFPPTHTAGAENYTFGVAHALAKKGHQVQVLCAGGWDEGVNYWNGYTDEQQGALAVRRIHINWKKAPDPNRFLYENPVVGSFLLQELSRIQPDIVHITSCYTFSASVINVIKEAGYPVVLTLVDFWFLCPTLHLLRSDGQLCEGKTTAWECLRCLLFWEKLYRWPSRVLPEFVTRPLLSGISRHTNLNRRRGLRGMALNMDHRKSYLSKQLQEVDAVLAPTRFLADVHAGVIDNLSVQYHGYGIDLTWLNQLRRDRKRGALRFSFLGQIVPVKGVDILIEAFLRLQDLPELSLDIWGKLQNGSGYAEKVRELAARSDRIHLRGNFSRAELGEVLSETDVVVVPSTWYENSPLTILESFAAGIPVIASSLGGMSELVEHEVNGLLVEPGSSQELAGQLRRLATEPGLMGRLRSGIREVKSTEQEVVELVELYSKLLQGAELLRIAEA